MGGKNFLIILLLLSSFTACKKEETLEPLFVTENIEFKDIKIEIPSEISTTVVQTNFIAKLTKPISGWIPIVGDLIQLPINLTTALLPPLPQSTYPQLPENSEWNNPEFLKSIHSLTLDGGFLRIAPVESRGTNYKPEQCWFYTPLPVYKDCLDVELNTFLYEVRVYLTFRQGQFSMENTQLDAEILLATANSKIDYSQETHSLSFHTTGVNLKPYLVNYKRFDVKVVASGKFPERKVYMDGALKIGLTIKLKK